MGRVVVLGALTVDLVTLVERCPRPGETVTGEPGGRFAGGRGGNQAMAARRAGADVTMLGAVGDDDAGRAYRSRLERAGIRCLVEVRPDEPTGTSHAVVDETGERSVVVVTGANHQAGAADAGLRPGDVLLCSLEGCSPDTVSRVSLRAARAGARVVINLAPYTALPHEVVALADPLVVGESQMRLLADSDLMPRSLLVTFGAAGARWDGEQVDGIRLAPGLVVDEEGAGDTFCGALAAALASGADRTAALAAANRAAASAVRWSGSQPDAAL